MPRISAAVPHMHECAKRFLIHLLKRQRCNPFHWFVGSVAVMQGNALLIAGLLIFDG